MYVRLYIHKVYSSMSTNTSSCGVCSYCRITETDNTFCRKGKFFFFEKVLNRTAHRGPGHFWRWWTVTHYQSKEHFTVLLLSLKVKPLFTLNISQRTPSYLINWILFHPLYPYTYTRPPIYTNTHIRIIRNRSIDFKRFMYTFFHLTVSKILHSLLQQ